MQAIDPKAMAAGAKNPHSSPASQAALESIMEYSPGFSSAQLPYDQKVPEFSKDDGSFFEKKLAMVSTLYRVCNRKGMAAETLQFMQARAKKSSGGSNTPQIMALWDAIGTANELNGFRSDPAGFVVQYGIEREFEIDGLTAINSLKEILSNKTGAIADNRELKLPSANDGNLMRSLAIRKEMAYAQFNRDKNQQRLDKELADIERARARPSMERKDKLIAQSWAKYENNIDQGRYTFFKNRQQALLDQSQALSDARTKILIKWLEAPLFIDTLEDYHEANPSDGIEFECAIGAAIQGINSCQSGNIKLQSWAQQTNIDKSSLLYRAIAQNQKEIINELKPYLSLAKEQKNHPYTEADFKEGMKTLTSGQKLADVYKKALSLESTNAKAKSETGTKAFGIALKAAPTGKLDVFIKTAGTAILQAFNPLFAKGANPATLSNAGHFLGEKYIQMILSTRALVAPSDAQALIKEQYQADVLRKQAKNAAPKPIAPLTTKEILKREAGFRRSQGKVLGEAWGNFQKNKPTDYALALKDMRLTLLVVLIEGVNLGRIMTFYHDDLRTQALIAASAISFTAGLVDLAGTPLKNALSAGADSVTFQKLKLLGGGLSTVAGAIGAGVDFSYSVKERKNGNVALEWLYFAKGAVGGSSALLTGVSTFTYAAPILRGVGQVAAADLAGALGARAGAVIATRIFFMSAGLWLTVGAFTIQLIIWKVTDDALEKWLDATPFGIKRNQPDAFQDSDEMKEALEAAIKEALNITLEKEVK
ncbi:MAG: hypothetical protein NT086_20875 [Proteobacteria bacterium]|nr:hypothetical protein [Pseudomonadota bacterium]